LHAEVGEYDLKYAGWDPKTKKDPEWREELAYRKWLVLRKPVMREPQFQEVDYTPEAGTRLVDKFCGSGLQIIVKMASIELTPEKPRFSVGSWHVEGQMNEHICATALYYLDSDNITPSSLTFRVQTSDELYAEKEFDVGQEEYKWMQSFYGTELYARVAPCLQNYGTVETREKRLLAFPNVL
jgi:hypothetical protein